MESVTELDEWHTALCDRFKKHFAFQHRVIKAQIKLFIMVVCSNPDEIL
jgi:hypothetical protein